MFFSLDVPVNIVELVATILAWGLIIYLMYYFYKKQEVKPIVWKACIVTLIGVFTLNIDFTMFNTIVSIPILPLGVWIVLWYASSREGAWERYRRFAWLGFAASFIFVASTLMSIFIHDVVYPKNNISTFIGNYGEATIVQLHPSAKDVHLDKESIDELLSTFEEERVNSVHWYSKMFEVEPHEREEQFPYQLSGTSSKWGSGISTIVYVEKDGKGLLIDSAYKQRYFRSNETILKGGNGE